MKKAILAATCVAALSTFTIAIASAQTGGSAAQESSTAAKDKMEKDGMKREGMGTTGMSKDGMNKDGMAKDGMSKEMSKDGAPSADTTKKKDGMSK
jgi:pentapeptide MXKDX repeat protein